MSSHRFPRRILAGLALLAALAVAVPAAADYLGPNRTLTIRVWRRLHCRYQAIYDPPGPGWWGCYLNLYYPPDASCPTDVAAYFTPSDCSWPEAFCQTQGCRIDRSESVLSCREGETGCRGVEQTTTYPEATVSGSVSCAVAGNGGWCRGGAALSLSGSEPVSGYSILALEGTRNGETFACPGASCSVPLVEGTNDFTFWALSSWGDSSRMGTASGRLDSSPPAISGQVTGAAGEDGWYISEVTVTAGASDAVSGVAAFEVSLSGSSWRPYAGALTLSDGEHRLDLRASDVAGNMASRSLSVPVDTVAPEVTLSAGGSFCPGCGHKLEVRLSVADGGSGLGEWSLGVGGTVLRSGREAVSETFSWDGSGLGAGSHTLSLEASDRAGNTAGASVTIWLIAPTPVPARPTSPAQGAPGAGGGGASGPLNPLGGANPTQAPAASATSAPTRTPYPTRTHSTSSFGGAPAEHRDGVPAVPFGGVGGGSAGQPGGGSAGEPGPSASTSSSGVLWGAAAVVVIAGATAAALEAARRRQEEEERLRAEVARKNAEAEAREAEIQKNISLAHLAALAAAAASAAAAAKDKGRDDEWPPESRLVGHQPATVPPDDEERTTVARRPRDLRQVAERRDEPPPPAPAAVRHGPVRWADEGVEAVDGTRHALAVRHLRFTQLESGHVSVQAETPPGRRIPYREQVAREGFSFRGTRYTRWNVATRTIGGLFRRAVRGSWVGAAAALGQNLWTFGSSPQEGATFWDRTVKNREFWVSSVVDIGVSLVAGLAAAAVVSGGIAVAVAAAGATAATAPLWLVVGATAGIGIGIGLGLEALGVPQWGKALVNSWFQDG